MSDIGLMFYVVDYTTTLAMICCVVEESDRQNYRRENRKSVKIFPPTEKVVVNLKIHLKR